MFLFSFFSFRAGARESGRALGTNIYFFFQAGESGKALGMRLTAHHNMHIKAPVAINS